MCLTTKKLKLRIAKRNLTFYKVMTTDDKSNYEVYYPLFWNDDPFILNSKYALPVGKEHFDVYKCNIEIGEGFFHLYKTKRHAKEISSCSLIPNTVILKAIVPKGALYIKGDDGTIATKEVIYKKL